MDSPYHNKRTGGSTKSIGPVLKENDAFFWIVRFIDEESSEATLQTGKTVPESESTALFTFGSQLQSSWLEYTCWEPSVATKPKMGMGDKRKWLSVQKMVQRTKSGQAAAPWPQRSKKVWQKMPLFGIFVHFLADKASFLKTLVLLENWACLWLLRPTHSLDYVSTLFEPINHVPFMLGVFYGSLTHVTSVVSKCHKWLAPPK